MAAAIRSLEEPGRGWGAGKQRSGLLQSPGGAWLHAYITRIRRFRSPQATINGVWWKAASPVVLRAFKA
jgi:hypothetical protein